MDAERPPFLSRWHAFVAERFPPLAHLVMVGAFFAGNAAIVPCTASGGRVACAAVATLLGFFRLRIFDDIKDDAGDAVADRPLAQIGLTEAKSVAVAVALAECALASACGAAAVVAWLLLCIFSLLMYREFFIATWLRPKIVLYAIAHTAVAVLFGLFVMSALSGRAPWELEGQALLFAVSNWFVFNVYEFARKTFAREDEEVGVPSYSARFGSRGAAFMTMAMVVASSEVAGRVLNRMGVSGFAFGVPVVVVLVTGLVSVRYARCPDRAGARVFRTVMRAFTIGYYLAIAACVRCAVG